MRYLVMAIPSNNLVDARSAFDNFFNTYLKNTNWEISIGAEPSWRDKTVLTDLYVVACFQESQYVNGFTEQLQMAAMTHDPSFASFGAYADVVQNPFEFLDSCNLERIPVDPLY